MCVKAKFYVLERSFYVPYSVLLISNTFCNERGGGPLRGQVGGCFLVPMGSCT
jgi:hypothetical protein